MTGQALVVARSRTSTPAWVAAPLLGVIAAALFASVFVTAFAAAGAVTLIALPDMRRRRVANAARRRRMRRHRWRTRRLRDADILPVELHELTKLVEHTITSDRDAHDVESLLDRYVELAIARDGLASALGKLRRHQQSRLAALAPGRGQTRAVLERSLADVEQLARSAEATRLDLENVVALIHHYCERAQLPALVESDQVEMVLEVFDEADL